MRVAVIGAGVMGCAAARALGRRGHEVTIYEQFEIGHKRGSSHGPTRIYRFSYPDERYVRMMKEAFGLWRELEAESQTEILLKTGGLDMGKDLDAHVRGFEAHEVPYEVIDGRKAAQRWPMLTLPEGDVLFQGDGGVVLAERAWSAFAQSAATVGATLEQGHRIDELSSDGLVGFDVTVVTAGGWVKKLLVTAGIELDVKPTRETVAYFEIEDVPPTLVDWGNPSVYAQHDPIFGLKAGEHIAGPETEPEDDGAVNQASIDRLVEWVKERYRDADAEPRHSETCIYTNTSDEHFVLERRGSIVIGSACSGHGFKFAPLIGSRLADLAESV